MVFGKWNEKWSETAIYDEKLSPSLLTVDDAVVGFSSFFFFFFHLSKIIDANRAPVVRRDTQRLVSWLARGVHEHE